MKSETAILIFVWFITFAVIYMIPKDKWRIALVAMLFNQLITWVTGLVVVQYHFITYPVKFFSTVNKASFTYEFFVYPVVCGFFNAFYPNSRSKLIQFMYYVAYVTVLAIPEVLLEKYTELIHYIHWSWYWSWITLFLTFWATRSFCVWFFRGLEKEID